MGTMAYVFRTGGVAGWVFFFNTGGLVLEDGICVFVGSASRGQMHCDFDIVVVEGCWHSQSQRKEDEGLSEFHCSCVGGLLVFEQRIEELHNKLTR